MSLKRPRDESSAAEGPIDTSLAQLSRSDAQVAPAVGSPVGSPLATASAARQLGVISWVDAASGFGALVKVALQEGSDTDASVFFHVSRIVYASAIGPAPLPPADGSDATAPAPTAGQLVSFMLSSNDAGELWADDVRSADGDPLPLPTTEPGSAAPSVAPGMFISHFVDAPVTLRTYDNFCSETYAFP